MRTLFFALLLSASPALSHEFWISPEDYTVEPGAPLEANLRVGEAFSGSSYPYIPRNFKRFDLVVGGENAPYEGRVGDNPALNTTIAEDTLVVVVHESRDMTLRYSEFQKFLNFAKHKDFATAEADHLARGLSTEVFVEEYTRFAKSLIAVGSGAGADAITGLRTEIIAGANPYTDDLTDGLPVRVIFDGAPRADAQVELFDRDPEGAVEVTLHRTDTEGLAVLPVRAGHEYLVDAVVLEPVDGEGETDPVWRSLWASLTFSVPARP